MKTEDSERLLEIGPLAVAALRRRLKEAQKEGHDAPDDLVFPTMDGKPCGAASCAIATSSRSASAPGWRVGRFTTRAVP